MKTDRPFFDTNVLLYVLFEDSYKADRAEAIIAMGGVISVQINQNMQRKSLDVLLGRTSRLIGRSAPVAPAVLCAP